jgi:hypothetical protein
MQVRIAHRSLFIVIAGGKSGWEGNPTSWRQLPAL